jgi:glycerol-3-phosphate cytidylyltransferase|tara:strand:+ start:145 stop:600 length:456 start_codon:yes stop_codon:yes gene_type:complete
MIVKKIYIGGTFDLFHYGHVNVFKNLKYHLNKESLHLGALSKIIVAVNSDSFAESYKRVPIMDQYQRLAVVNSCRYVDYAFIMDSYENQPFFIEENNPDFIVMGSDWQSRDYFKQLCITQEFLDRIGAEMLFLPYTDGISTTEIIEKIKKL